MLFAGRRRSRTAPHLRPEAAARTGSYEHDRDSIVRAEDDWGNRIWLTPAAMINTDPAIAELSVEPVACQPARTVSYFEIEAHIDCAPHPADFLRSPIRSLFIHRGRSFNYCGVICVPARAQSAADRSLNRTPSRATVPACSSSLIKPMALRDPRRLRPHS